MTDRCEPPPELRGVDGWYWVCGRSGLTMPAHWYASPRDGIEPLWRNLFTQQTGTPAWAAAEWEWRYIAPVATPAEVDALRAERDAAISAFDLLTARVAEAQGNNVLGQFLIREITLGAVKDNEENTTLRARVAELEAAVEELIGPYTGGADNTLDDPYIMERARAALEGSP